MDIRKIAVALLRIQGAIFLSNDIFDLTWMHSYLYALFHYDAYNERSVFQVIESGMFIARFFMNLLFGFLLLRYASVVAVFLTRDLEK